MVWGATVDLGAVHDILYIWEKHSDICLIQHKQHLVWANLLKKRRLIFFLGGAGTRSVMKNYWDTKHSVHWESLVTFRVKSIGIVNGETWTQLCLYQWLILYTVIPQYQLGIGSRMPLDTKICGCSSPLYKWHGIVI